MLRKYRFVEPRTEKTVLVGPWSYLWAGFLGPLYVMFKAGPQKLLQSLILSLGLALGFLAFVIKGLVYVPGNFQGVVLVLLVPVLFVLHSVKSIGLVRASYLQRNWHSRPID